CVPLLALACLVYAACVAMIGLWISALSSSSQRAFWWTLLATFGLTVGHWLPWFLGCAALSIADEFMRIQASFTPPLALCRYLTLGWHDEVAPEFYFALLGLFAWAIGTYAAWAVFSEDFRQMRRQSLPPKSDGNLGPVGGQYQGSVSHTPG